MSTRTTTISGNPARPLMKFLMPLPIVSICWCLTRTTNDDDILLKEFRSGWKCLTSLYFVCDNSSVGLISIIVHPPIECTLHFPAQQNSVFEMFPSVSWIEVFQKLDSLSFARPIRERSSPWIYFRHPSTYTSTQIVPHSSWWRPLLLVLAEANIYKESSLWTGIFSPSIHLLEN